MYVFHCCWLYRQEAEREGKRRLKPQGGHWDSITPSSCYFDLLYRGIYIKTKHLVYIHSPSHGSCSLCAYMHFLLLLFLHLSSSSLSILCFFLSSGRQLHAEALWISELQDTISKNCSTSTVFLWNTEWDRWFNVWTQLLSLTWCLCQWKNQDLGS